MLKMHVTEEMLHPYAAYEEAGALDLRIDRDVILAPGATTKVGTGVYPEIPKGHVGLVLPRSGVSQMQLVNTVGVIDSDYRGEIFAKIRNVSSEPLQLFKGDRFLQMMVIATLPAKYEVVSLDTLSKTMRGVRGDGSSSV